MMEILYTVFIFPIEEIISLAYLFVFRVFNNPALSVLGVSFAVSVLTLPLYFMAESLQRTERDIQKRMKPDVDNIRAVFSGDERFMRLAIYYRQNKYHPFYALRSSVSIFIQIPFFIAAYHFLSGAAMPAHVSFGPIADLAKPDSLLTIHGAAVNVLPLIMTLVNCAASAIYVKGFSAREKIQLYGMALIFLALLYNSPAALVLYWTGNNVFSLIKNILQKTKRPKLITFVCVSAVCLLLILYVLFVHDGWIVKRAFAAALFALVPLSLYAAMFLSGKRKKNPGAKPDGINKKSGAVFALSILVLFLLTGLVTPSSLIASSVEDFSFTDPYASPFSFLGLVFLQSLGVFIVWPLCVYMMFSRRVQTFFAGAAAVLAALAVINVFVFSGYYGFLTRVFTLSDFPAPNLPGFILNGLVLAAAALAALVMFRYRGKLLAGVLAVVSCAFVLLGGINAAGIHREFNAVRSKIENMPANENGASGAPAGVYQFSKTGKNVIVIMLDRAIAGYVPFIFEEKPELQKSFDGFTWYKNTASFGAHTVFCVPSVFGGYEYAPLEIQARKNVPLVEEHNEALLLLPRLFLDHKFNVTVTDPPLANYSEIPDLSIFENYPQINARNTKGRYSEQWLKDRNLHVLVTDVVGKIKTNLIRFSFFRMTPPMFRHFVYDQGKWLAPADERIEFMLSTLNEYAALDMLPGMTGVNETAFNSYTALSNDLTHETCFFSVPDYAPALEITNKGNGPFANEEHYHVNMAAMLLLGKWFDFLQANGVYNNTRIIVVADHGNYLASAFSGNIDVPDGKKASGYNPLLLVKDFDAHGNLAVDASFMTNADVPLIALEGIVRNPVNPWSGKPLAVNKSDGITITTSHKANWRFLPRNTFDINPDEWLHVHDDIFEPQNWSVVTK